MTPRPYQYECIQAAYDCFTSVDSVLVVMATGTGKTVVFSQIAKNQPGRVMVIAHREELIVQAAHKIREATGEWPAVEQGAENWSNETDWGRSKYVVASKDSLHEKRLGRFRDIDLLVIDEAHHATKGNESYYRIVKHLREQNPRLKILGVTATPKRHDGIGLGEMFEAVAYQFEIIDAVAEGWLVDADAKLIEITGLTLADVHLQSGDLHQGELADIMAEENNVQGIADVAFQECRDKRRVLCFTAGVEQAKKLAGQLNRREPDSAAWLCGKKSISTPQYRRECLKRFATGELKYIANCGILLEGYDEPAIDCLLMARPTKSESLYKQMFGRGTRTLAGIVDGLATAEERRAAIAASAKPAITVLDFVDNSRRHKLVSSVDILGGRCSPDVLEIARAAIEEKTKAGQAARLDYELIEAEREKQRRKEAEEERRRKHLAAKAKYEAQRTDVFDGQQRGVGRQVGRYEDRPTPKQAYFLRLRGIDTQNLTKRQCSAIIGKLKQKEEEEARRTKKQEQEVA